MIRSLSNDIYNELFTEDRILEKNRNIISQQLIIDEDTERGNLQRDIVVDATFLAINFAIDNKFTFEVTSVMLDIISLEFTSLMDPNYDLMISVEKRVKDMKDIFLSKVSNFE
jgi:hypothetical protein